jgi:hypothetical protein
MDGEGEATIGCRNSGQRRCSCGGGRLVGAATTEGGRRNMDLLGWAGLDSWAGWWWAAAVDNGFGSK